MTETVQSDTQPPGSAFAALFRPGYLPVGSGRRDFANRPSLFRIRRMTTLQIILIVALIALIGFWVWYKKKGGA